jgi:hypothetical protein
MRKLRFLGAALVAAVAVAFGASPSAQAQTTAHTYSSTITVQNLSSSVANITLSFYPEGSGTASADVTGDTVPASGVKAYGTLPSSVAAGFSGSAVISSDQNVAAIVNVAGDSLNFGLSSYSGFSSGSKSVSLPLLFRNTFGFSTFFNVQNVGANPTNVTITYKGTTTTGTPVNASQGPFSIPASSAKRLDQSAAGVPLPDGFVGSATITSDAENVVATVIQVGPSTMLGYNGFTGGSTNPVLPLINTNNSGFSTGVQIQNLGNTATNVTISYTPSSPAVGTACTETKSVPANGATTFALNAFIKSEAGENCANGPLFVGTGKVTANSASQPLVAIVNQLNSAAKKGDSYGGFDPAAATSTVVLPLIEDRVFGYFTGISIMNVGSVATPVTCTFTNSAATQSTASLAPGAAFTAVQANAIANTYVGSGTCKATAVGAKIVGVVNVLKNGTTSDTFSVYSATNN